MTGALWTLLVGENRRDFLQDENSTYYANRERLNYHSGHIEASETFTLREAIFLNGAWPEKSHQS